MRQQIETCIEFRDKMNDMPSLLIVATVSKRGQEGEEREWTLVKRTLAA